MEFRERDGRRRRATRNLLDVGVDALVVIGGDGNLTGANLLREEWPALLVELVDAGEVHPERYAHSVLAVRAGRLDRQRHVRRT